MLIRLIIIFFFLDLTLCAQDSGLLYTEGHTDSIEVKKYIDSEIKEAYKKKMIISANYEFVGDTMIVKLIDSIYGVTHKFTFNAKDTIFKNDSEFSIKAVCDYQEVIYDCSPCSKRYLKSYQKFYKFRQIAENKFLSKPLYSTEMEVLYKNGNTTCMTLKFRRSDLSRKNYQKLYKSLKKM